MALMKKSQYDKDADGIIDQAKDADTVDGKHATDFEQVANKGAANGYCDLDANSLVPLSRIPTPLTGKDADTVDGKHATDFEQVANKGAANGYAPLDANSHVPVANLPDVVKTSNLQNFNGLRSLGTIYQNTTGKYLLVLVTVYIGVGTSLDISAFTGNVGATDEQARSRNATSNLLYTSIVFVVPPNFYYKVRAADSGNFLYMWWEVTI